MGGRIPIHRGQVRPSLKHPVPSRAVLLELLGLITFHPLCPERWGPEKAGAMGEPRIPALNTGCLSHRKPPTTHPPSSSRLEAGADRPSLPSLLSAAAIPAPKVDPEFL